ncbi:MAG TPA: alpha/beta family hydrolase [Terriglobales bacterium]|nr:alpha/beta family hydrolase [Terriglobales bacterium]
MNTVNSSFEPFSDASADPPVRGFLGHPQGPVQNGLVLTHGAGGNCRGSLLVALAQAFVAVGFAVLRCDLPFRQDRPYGPPRPGNAARDREGLRNAVKALQKLGARRIFLAGQSYGGRQATMLCADAPELAAGLLPLSYPLHPPGKSDQLRTQHLPRLTTPALFVQGTRDPFGSIQEMEAALRLIPAKTSLLTIEGVGHDLGFKGNKRLEELPTTIGQHFQSFFGGSQREDDHRPFE